MRASTYKKEYGRKLKVLANATSSKRALNFSGAQLEKIRSMSGNSRSPAREHKQDTNDHVSSKQKSGGEFAARTRNGDERSMGEEEEVLAKEVSNMAVDGATAKDSANPAPLESLEKDQVYGINSFVDSSASST
ncbi:hypothetical protein U9M48_040220 [Paspalum notatum var. saurae]|uniref:Uncharacterized protein n=1 Tax=Paspalum notatum var. saurae TaxID=547442 RepID=A0AAQ3URV0_PASNO